MATYKTFLRSATSFEQFARARKITQRTGLSYVDALALCDRFNAARTTRQIRKGTKMEFTAE